MHGIDIIQEIYQDINQEIRKLSNRQQSSMEINETNNSDHEIINNSLHLLEISLQGLQGSYQILSMIINRCTDYTKLSHGIELVPNYEPVDVRLLAKQLIFCLQGLQSKVTIELQPIDTKICSFILTDRQWLQENLFCLLTNAIKFTTSLSFPSYQPTHLNPIILRIYLTDFPSHDTRINEDFPFYQEMMQQSMIRFEVEDQGIGISTSDMNTMFQIPDFSKRKSIGGGGLGLFCLAKRIIALKGEYGVNSSLTNGTMIWFSIPYKKSEVSSTEKEEKTSSLSPEKLAKNEITCKDLVNQTNESLVSPQITRPKTLSTINNLIPNHKKTDTTLTITNDTLTPPTTSTISTKHTNKPKKQYHILLVDDSIAILKMLKMMLEKHGHIVDTATNGYEALILLHIIDPLALTSDHSLDTNDIQEIIQKKSLEQKQNQNYNKENHKRNLKRNHKYLQNNEIKEEINECKPSETNTKEPFNISYPHYDIILMDLQMPVLNGFETVRMIRQYESIFFDPRNNDSKESFGSIQNEEINEETLFTQDFISNETTKKNFPLKSNVLQQLIFALSANFDPQTVSDAYTAGVNNFIPKPFTIQSFDQLMIEYEAKQPFKPI